MREYKEYFKKTTSNYRKTCAAIQHIKLKNKRKLKKLKNN